MLTPKRHIGSNTVIYNGRMYGMVGKPRGHDGGRYLLLGGERKSYDRFDAAFLVGGAVRGAP